MSVSRSPAPWRSRPRIRRGILTISVLVLTITPLVATETAAQAHAVLERTSPAKGAVLTAAPTEIVLTFDEPPQQLGSAVQVSGPSGVVSQGTPTLSGAEVHQALSATLADGAYQVAWRVVSDDGHPVAGTFAFTIRAATTPTSATATGPTTGAPDSATPAFATTQEATNPWPWVVAAVALLALIGLSIWRFTRHDKEAA